MQIVSNRRNLLSFILAIGLVQFALYYFAGAMVRPDGGMAVPQPDTLLYCQAARRIAEGSAFSFSNGTAASTGTTSYAYPFALAIPYLLGCGGDALMRAGFVLNGAFYIVFLMCWGLVIDEKLKSPLARLTAAVAIACTGQTAYSAFAQSDIGMWLAFSGVFAAGLACRKRLVYGLVLVAAPWVRPEGMVCVIAFSMVLCAVAVLRRLDIAKSPEGRLSPARLDVLVAVLAIASVAGVLAANYAIGGSVQFSSIAHKGYFKTLPFANAVFATSIDFLKLLKGVVLGIPDGAPRDFYCVPVLGAVLACAAVLLRDWRRADWREAVWLLAVFGGMLTVSQSGWQNTNVDRYVGWMLPTVLFFAAEGAGVVYERLKSLPASWLPGAVLCLFAACTMPLFACMLHMTSRDSDLIRAFAVNCNKKMEPGKSVGSWGDCGIAYEMGARKVAHLGGIYSPEYAVSEQPYCVYEILKNEPATRVDYLFYNPAGDSTGLAFEPLDAFCSQTLVGPYGYELRKMDWTCFDAAARAPAPGARGLSLKDRVDVGYESDEKGHSYEALPLYSHDPIPPFVVWGDCGGRKMIEVGRMVLGSDSMSVRLEPGRDVHVVMRTWPSHKASVRGSFGDRSVTYAFSNPLKIKVLVDGVDVGTHSLAIADKGFSDVEMTIPRAAISGERQTVEFQGEHIACAYWFFQ